MLLVAALALAVQKADERGFLEDPKFPVVAFLGDPGGRRNAALRLEDATLVVLSGPGQDWLVGWDLLSGQRKFQAKAPRLADNSETRELSPSGRHVYVVRGGTIRCFDGSSGALLKTLSATTRTGHPLDDRLLGDAFPGPKEEALRTFLGKMYRNQGLPRRMPSADRRVVAGTTPEGGSLVVVDADKAKVLVEIPLPPGSLDNPHVALSENRAVLALARESEVWIADVSKKKFLHPLVGHTDRIFSDMKLSPDGSRLLTSGLDGTTRLWDPRRVAEKAVVKTSRFVCEGFLLGTEKAAAIVDERRTRVMDLEGKILRVVGTHLTWHARLTEDGRFAVCPQGEDGDATLSFWGLDPPRLLREAPLNRKAQAVELSADGRYAAVLSGDTLIVLDREKEIPLREGPRPQRLVGLLPGASAVLVTENSSLVALDVADGATRWSTEFRGGVRQARLDGSGARCLVVTGEGLPRVVDTSTGQAWGGSKFLPGARFPEEARVSADGRTLVTLNPDAREITWWTADGDAVKSVKIGPELSGNGLKLSSSADAQRAFVYTNMAIAAASAEKGVEKVYVYHRSTSHTTFMYGETALIDSHGAAVVRYRP